MLPGRLLLHPVMLSALATLVVNDHWGKAYFHNAVTGVLSDIAGMVFFPALLLAVVEWSAECAGRSRSLSPRPILLWLCVATAVVFALTKTTAVGNEAYRVGLGALQWPFSAVHSLAFDGALPPLRRVSLLRDPWDLLAVPFAFVSWALWLAERASQAAPSLVREQVTANPSTSGGDCRAECSCR